MAGDPEKVALKIADGADNFVARLWIKLHREIVVVKKTIESLQRLPGIGVIGGGRKLCYRLSDHPRVGTNEPGRQVNFQPVICVSGWSGPLDGHGVAEQLEDGQLGFRGLEDVFQIGHDLCRQPTLT